MLRRKFSQWQGLRPSDLDISSADQFFLQKLLDIVETNIEENSFSVVRLAKEIGMSRSQLHRKLKAISGQSALEFIQSVRLQRAADLISKNGGNIAEIAYQVGFSDPSYFTRVFKKQFGKTPSEYTDNPV